ncbi:hypothetical protein DsansV1_C37g0232771 [Dioscorea sansibarensis]
MEGVVFGLLGFVPIMFNVESWCLILNLMWCLVAQIMCELYLLVELGVLIKCVDKLWFFLDFFGWF